MGLLSGAIFELDTEESINELTLEVGSQTSFPDDLPLELALQRHLQILMESLARIGGEVCRLRAEMDGLLEQNSALTTSFIHLKDVIVEKGSLDLDDFDLACDVLASSSRIDSSPTTPVKKIAH